jgi:hypothetical protein
MRRWIRPLLLTVLLVGACDAAPAPTGPLAGESPTPDPSGSAPPATEEPFTAAGWPSRGDGAAGLPRRPGGSGATPGRSCSPCASPTAASSQLAHPALGILGAPRSSATGGPRDRRPSRGRSYRDAWTPGENVRLVLGGKGAAAAADEARRSSRWAADPLQRRSPSSRRSLDARARRTSTDRDPARADRPRATDSRPPARLQDRRGWAAGRAPGLAASLTARRSPTTRSRQDRGQPSAVRSRRHVAEGWYGSAAPAASAAWRPPAST